MRGWSPPALYLLAALGPGWRVELDLGKSIRVRHRDGDGVHVDFRLGVDGCAIFVYARSRRLEDQIRSWFVGTGTVDSIARWLKNSRGG